MFARTAASAAVLFLSLLVTPAVQSGVPKLLILEHFADYFG